MHLQPNDSIIKEKKIKTIHSDEGLMLSVSFETLYGGQIMLLTQLIKPNDLVILQHRRSTSFLLPPPQKKNQKKKPKCFGYNSFPTLGCCANVGIFYFLLLCIGLKNI